MDSTALPSATTSLVVSRRQALRFLALTPGVALLAACGTSATTAPAAPAGAPASSAAGPAGIPSASISAQAPSTGLKLPTRVPIQGPAPDLPGSDDGNIDPVYKTFPKNLFKSVNRTVGDGSDISILSWSFGAPPTPLDQNAHWQAVNKGVNANLKVTMVAFADYYTTKLATTIAGGDLPDLLSIINDNTIVLQPEFFDAKCIDLTPYLSGDAIKEYPNLAAIPTRPWKATVFNGKMWGVPQPLRPFFWWFWTHQELLDQAGLAQPKDTTDFKKQLQQLTKPQENLWGMGVEGGPQYSFAVQNGLFPAVFKAPNNWAVDASGKFTASLETDQFKQSVAYARDLFSAGVFNPDGTGWNTLSARDAFNARKIAYRFDGLDANYWLAAPQLKPPANVRVVAPFSNDGSKPSYFFGRPNFGFMAIKKGISDARVKMLLRVLDFLAAPFGSEEYLLLHYGVKGIEFNFDDKGNPILTDKGKSAIIPWNTVVGPTPILFTPLSTDVQVALQDAEKTMYAAGVDDPSIGLYSSAWATKNVVLTRNFGDGLNAIIQGQKPMSDYDSLVKAWLAGGGSDAKTEFQKSYLAAKT